jgi:hypothetical protein
MHKTIMRCVAILLFLSPGLIQAQSFTFIPQDTILSAPLGSEIVFDCTITNTSASSLTLVIIRTTNDLPAGWESSLCITVCYPPEVDTALAPSINPGDTLPFSVHVYSAANPGTATIRVVARNTHNASDQRVLTFHATSPPVGVVEGSENPIAFALYQNYPNPFNSTTTIEFTLPSAAHVELIVYNALGQKVKTLVNQVQGAGYQCATFDAGNLASGMYIYRLQTGEFSQTRRLLLLR